MSRAGVLILLSVLIILTPFSGLPSALRTLLTVIFGLCVFGISLALRSREPREIEPTPAQVPAPEAESKEDAPRGVSPI